MDNPEKLVTLDTHDTWWKDTLENTEGAIKNGQSRDTGNIGYTRRKDTLENTKGWNKNEQSRDTSNIGYTRRKDTLENTEG
jgi:hypothetical protein